MKHIYSFLILLLALASTACTKLDLANMDNMGYQFPLAIPVCTFKASIASILSKQDTSGHIIYDGDTISIYWTDKAKSKPIDIIQFTEGHTVVTNIELQNTSAFANILSVLPEGAHVTLPKGSYSFQESIMYEFGFDSITPTVEYIVDSIMINSTDINLAVDVAGFTFSSGSYIDLTISFPDLKPKAKSVSVRVNANHTDISRTITHFLADFSEDIPDVESGLKMVTSFKFVSDGAAVINKNAAVNLTTRFVKIDFDVAYGRFWNQNPVYEDIVTVDVPSDIYESELFKDNRLLLHDPNIILNLSHNLGTDIRLVIDSIYTTDSYGGKHYADFNGKKRYTTMLNRPENPHDSATTTLVFNRANGATNKLFEEVPKVITMKYRLFAGQAMGVHDNFITPPVHLTYQPLTVAEMSLDPTSFFAKGDTIKADLASIDSSFHDYANIDTFFLYLTAYNNIPTELTLNLEFLDSLNNSLFYVNDIIIDCPEISESGEALNTTHQQVVPIVFVGDDIKKIIKTKKICFQTLLAGKDDGARITFRTSDNIQIDITAFAKVKANLSKWFNN